MRFRSQIFKERTSIPGFFLILLLSIDLLFIVLFLVQRTVDNVFPTYSGFLLDRNFMLGLDRSYSELFQYLKEFSISVVLFLLFIQRRRLTYLSWSAVFFYLLLDDSLQFHEKLGDLIASFLSYSPLASLPAEDFGELVASLLLGGLLLSLVVIGYYFSDSYHRKISQHLILMLFLLAFFGILTDLIHALILSGDSSRTVGIIFLLIEEGGEMFTMSLILWYVLRLYFLPDPLAIFQSPLLSLLP